ncbi:MAG: helix-turn-helix transcriptional regulator [Clostridia bacterium]|nr:helix-turn-helix transcriptional regulator [Clostridia bacterium]
MKIKTLKQLRENKKLTQEQASKELDVTKEYLSMLERAERNPSDKMKERMASLYGCKTVDIFLACEETKCFRQV